MEQTVTRTNPSAAMKIDKQDEQKAKDEGGRMRDD